MVGDPRGPPPRQLPVSDACPESGSRYRTSSTRPTYRRQRVGSHAQRGRELDHRELRHARRSRTGQRETGVPAVLHDRRRLVGRDLVGGAVLDHVPEHPHLGRVPLGPVGAHRIEESDLRVTLELEHGCCCHDPYSTRHHRHPAAARDGLWMGILDAATCGCKVGLSPVVEPDSRLPGSRRSSLALAARPAWSEGRALRGWSAYRRPVRDWQSDRDPGVSARSGDRTLDAGCRSATLAGARSLGPAMTRRLALARSSHLNHRQEGPGQFLSGCGTGRPGCSPPRLSR